MSTAAPDNSYLQEEDNSNLDHIPGEYGLPLIGKAIPFLKDPLELIEDHYNKYGEVSRIRIGEQKGLLVIGGENYKTIYLDRDKNFSARMGYKCNLGSMYPDTILLSDFADHKPLRRMFQSAFKNDAMRTYVDMMNPVLKRNIEKFKDEKNFEFFPAVKKTLIDVAAKVFIGIDDLDGEEAQRLAESFSKSSDGLTAFVRKEFPGGKFKRGKEGIAYQREFFSKLVVERRGKEGTDTLTYLCNERDDEGNLFADNDIIDQMVFLLFAAHDTTTSALCNMVYHTAKDKQWQQRIRDEAEPVNNEFISYDDLDSRIMTDLVFHEALRLYPSVPLMQRRTIKECEIGGHKIPANTILFIPPTYNHHLTEYWTNPKDFDPERFAPSRQEHKSHSFAYLPFGGGAHKCIGMHFAAMIAKNFMHQLVLHYDYSLTSVQDNHKMDYFPLPKPSDGVPLVLKALK